MQVGAALTFAGIAFAIWARVWIAGNWSSDVTLKRDHELIVTGPYRWVRHPIYTGILVALIGTALAVGEWRGALAVVLAAGAFWRKLRSRRPSCAGSSARPTPATPSACRRSFPYLI